MSATLTTVLRLAADQTNNDLFDRLLLRNLPFMLDLATALDRKGAAGDVVEICESVLAWNAGNVTALHLLGRALARQGRIIEALGRFAELKGVRVDMTPFMDDVREVSTRAIDIFNGHLSEGRLSEAADHIDALATLISEHPAILDSALAVSRQAGRTDRAGHYARKVLAFDPNHAMAREAMKEEHEGHANLPPAVRLWHIYERLKPILCAELSPDRVALARELTDSARKIPRGPADGPDDLPGWEVHYRLMIEAFDLSAIAEEPPRDVAYPDIVFADARGRTLGPNKLASLAARAKVGFFVAADERYVEMYARLYVASVLKHCDVDCLVVVHVIGGMGRLSEIAAKVGIGDVRLVFSGDIFDPAAITTKCYESPPKGLLAHPAAHYQSARFQWLGYLLKHLKLPIFVSDIDLLLQGRVADLLEQHAAADLVFNENTYSDDPGARLTANLLLVRPTASAEAFLCYLRSFLDQALGASKVTRWIDQVALVMGRHHLAARPCPARIAYFDTDSDINNLIYPSYRENPYRFLSLYHGFDLTSLEGNP